ncbi:hypothetical protein RJ639_008698 [Escallonia herrerae]|uniref:Myb-like domain-containing protein n=1 Tax=Escallonia herrerae TaxID=1293975 RepID=A0AA88V7L3_9ASTE|nr:hypothetical protein RJ639_018290 [Escallonia herrerae]KAK3013952.1 hypothetical protein RJ639_008698 [Escallonia herrerae]
MSGQVGWEWEENKAFEIAIALHLLTGSDEEWEKIASMVPKKTIDEVKEHYKVLVEDIKAIEMGSCRSRTTSKMKRLTLTLSRSPTHLRLSTIYYYYIRVIDKVFN